MNSKADMNHFMRLSIRAGGIYLSCGGPTSRMEEMVVEAGEALGYETEVFGSPTGIFVTCSNEDDTDFSKTLLGRQNLGSVDLSNVIQIEKIFADISSQKIGVDEAGLKLDEILKGRRSKWLLFFSVFVVGIAASFLRYGSFQSALCSGFITLLISWMSGPLAAGWRLGGIFGGFLGTFVCLLLAGILSFWTKLAPEPLVIGALIYLVPGLTITNAVSELAEQNLLSGTAKMMHGVLTLLAMGSAIYLIKDLSVALNWNLELTNWNSSTDLNSGWIQYSMVAVIVASFSIIFNSRLVHTPLAVIAGLIGWAVFTQTSGENFIFLHSFLPSLMVGLFSLFIGWRLDIPSQIFSVPGIFTMLPGMLAFTGLLSGADDGNPVFVQVSMTACGIVFGLLTARIPFIVLKIYSGRWN